MAAPPPIAELAGAAVVRDAPGAAVVLLATGSEVSLCVEAQAALEGVSPLQMAAMRLQYARATEVAQRLQGQLAGGASVGVAVVTIALKTLAWWLTDSVGLLSDAAESVVNLLAALTTLWMLTLAARPPDEEHAYGHDKADTTRKAAAEGIEALKEVSGSVDDHLVRIQHVRIVAGSRSDDADPVLEVVRQGEAITLSVESPLREASELVGQALIKPRG